MKTNYDDNVLTLYLAGRVDANNAAEIEAEISDSLAKFPGAVPTFDAGELEYISSAGLRVLLKFRKKFGKSLNVINASNSVYDIFEVTGFTELFSVKKRLREISVDGLEIIGSGTFSTVYRLDPETIMKLYNKGAATLADVERDRLSSREIFLHGIPTAIPFDTVKSGQYYGLVYEMIDADTMAGVISKHPERLEELSIKAAHLLKKLHTTEFEQGTLPDARDRHHARVQRTFELELISAEDKAFADMIIDRIPYRNTFVHSDFHTKNLMVSGDDLVLIDVGEAGLGNPINDFLVSYMLFVEFGVSMPDMAKAAYVQDMGLDFKTLGEIWNTIIREYFGTSDKDTLKKYSDIMSCYTSIMMFEISTVCAGHGAHELGRKCAEKYITRLRKAADTLKPIEGI